MSDKGVRIEIPVHIKRDRRVLGRRATTMRQRSKRTVMPPEMRVAGSQAKVSTSPSPTLPPSGRQKLNRPLPNPVLTRGNGQDTACAEGSPLDRAPRLL